LQQTHLTQLGGRTNKKKEAKISSRFTKKQVQALWVSEKISTHIISINA
jgi:hypothetical protein